MIARNFRSTNTYRGGFIDDLYDSLQLTRTILPDLLPLINLNDYKNRLMRLLGQLVDSNLVKAKDYDSYFSKFFLESKQELKKQAIVEKQIAIRKAEMSKEENQNQFSLYEYNNNEEDETDFGNEDLSLYATLLLPFWDNRPNVRPVIDQMLASSDKRLKYNTMMLLIRNNKPYPDSLLKYFAEMDDYRYELYTGLQDFNKEKLFPVKYKNHLDLAKSKLLDFKPEGKPDSLVFVDSLPAELKNKKGFVFFFKYKNKKDDIGWKLATVGLVPEDPSVFEFKETVDDEEESYYYDEDSYSANYKYNLTGFTNTKIDEDEEPLAKQLGKELKKMLYSKRKSAREFYDNEEDYGNGLTITGDYDSGGGDEKVSSFIK